MNNKKFDTQNTPPAFTEDNYVKSVKFFIIILLLCILWMVIYNLANEESLPERGQIHMLFSLGLFFLCYIPYIFIKFIAFIFSGFKKNPMDYPEDEYSPFKWSYNPLFKLIPITILILAYMFFIIMFLI